MTALSTSIAEYLFKIRYADGLDNGALMAGNPLLSFAEHETDFATHKGIEIPNATGAPQGIGNSNANAVLAKSPGRGQSFVVPQRHIYLYADIDGEVVRNAVNGGDATQFRNAMTNQVDLATEAMGNELNTRMYGLNRGDRALLHATQAVNTTTLYLSKKTDAQFFEKDMQLQFLNPSTGALRTGGTGYVVVDAVNPEASPNGTLTLTGTLDTEVTSVVAGDIIIRRNMRNADLDGLQGWAPATPSASFLGVDQTQYVGRSCGLYVDQSSASVTSGLMYALARAQSYIGKRFDQKAPVFINPMQLHVIERDVEASRILSKDMQGQYGIGIPVKEIFGQRFVPDPVCPRDKAFFVGSGAFTRGSAGNQPRIEDQDGRKFWFNRQTGKLEFILVHDGNTYSYKPYKLLHVNLAPVQE